MQGFLSVVENGQYFITKDTGDLTQFNTVACREYTLPREESSITTERLDPREHQNWTRIGNWHGKYGDEIRTDVCEHRQFSLLGQKFSWIKQVCDEFEQQ